MSYKKVFAEYGLLLRTIIYFKLLRCSLNFIEDFYKFLPKVFCYIRNIIRLLSSLYIFRCFFKLYSDLLRFVIQRYILFQMLIQFYREFLKSVFYLLHKGLARICRVTFLNLLKILYNFTESFDRIYLFRYQKVGSVFGLKLSSILFGS